MRWSLTIVALLCASGAVLLLARVIVQARWADELNLNGATAILEEGFVPIDGLQQWVSIRGKDRANPVLLIVHGGPGGSLLPMAYDRLAAWEAYFTIVQWDQRGAGRTYSRNRRADGSDLSIDQIASDGVDVVAFALRRTGHKKLVLLGASWGSIIGVRMARLRPDLLHAYVGMGQVVDMPAAEAIGYRMLLQRVEAAGDTRSQAELERIGAPPYASVRQVLSERRVLARFPPPSERGLQASLLRRLAVAPGLSLRGAYDTVAAQFFSIAHLYGELSRYSDLDSPEPIGTPVVFIQGEQDPQTPTRLVERYAAALVGDDVKLVVLPEGGHMALLALGDEVLAVLLRDVRPPAMAQERGR